MKRITAIASAMFVTATAYAATDAEIYHGFEAGNPELTSEYATSSSSGNDSVGFDAYVYNGWESGNPELSYDIEAPLSRSGMPPQVGDSFGSSVHGRTTSAEIYHGFEVGNEDL